MTVLDDLLNEEQRRRVAFDLLTSSGLDRYVASAQAAEVTQRLRQTLRILPDMEQVLIDRARSLSRQVLASKQRVEAEVDLAILLAALSGYASRQVDQLLAEVGLLDTLSAAWPAGLARRLRRDRFSTLRFRQGREFSMGLANAVNQPWLPMVIADLPGPAVANDDAASVPCAPT
jgi:hypothetical protein